MPSARKFGKWQRSALIDLAFNFSKIRRRLKTMAAEIKPLNPSSQKGLDQLDAKSIMRIEKLWKQWLTRVHLFLEVNKTAKKDSRKVDLEKLSRDYMPKFVRQNLPILLGQTSETFPFDASQNPEELAISAHDKTTVGRNEFLRNLVSHFCFVETRDGSLVETSNGGQKERSMQCDSAPMVKRNFFLARANVMGKFFTSIPR
ncbi:hypothetical protein XU18_4970 [Perkinsela sp. CCAP 1560/4]|nr:hypothetical protein XU18_4970 [Perkinsela sp. CCAP 1560/4]|eukprot:KNH03700.1 hypothetical protein XU18_4970 [Perkinsela sp. CCAP 1560/4]